MIERPIMFSGPMARAILDGRKTQTRRPIKREVVTAAGCAGIIGGTGPAFDLSRCPYGQPGDRLWVRETWAVCPELNHLKPSELNPDWTEDRHGAQTATIPAYREGYPSWDPWPNTKWRPSIFMPRWASRITLEITAVRVERLQGITEVDVLAEGVPQSEIDKWTQWLHRQDCAGKAFGMLWDRINAKRGFAWDANPWVWVVQFQLETTEEG